MSLDLDASDPTTLSGRSRQVCVALTPCVSSKSIELIEQVDGDAECFNGDAGYDTTEIYDAAGTIGAEVVGPPVRRADVLRPQLPLLAREVTVLRVGSVGRGEWMKESSYHRQGRVESTLSRYTQILGGKLRACHVRAWEVDVILACRIHNRMTDLELPVSVAESA